MLFSKNFYPTPDHVIDRMIEGLDLQNKFVLEPSAGKGDIVKRVALFGAKTLICELNEDLAEISSSYAERFLKPDFLNVVAEEVSHIDFILMNPPFENADKHILHAWDVAPGGCTIIALCNWETVNNSYSMRRKSLGKLVEDNGTKENLKNCFSTAERKTDVEIGLIKLFKPKTGEDEFEGYFDLSEEYDNNDQDGIVKYNEVKDIVNRYVEAVKRFDKTIEAANELNTLIAPIKSTTIKFGASWTGYAKKTYSDITRDVFKKELQKSAWKEVFSRLKVEKYLTKSVMADINRFVEKQEKVPFTMTNIYKMVEMIVGTRETRFNKVIVEVFDWLTSHSFENRFNNPAWKTNSEYVVNKKFIAPYCGVKFGLNHAPEIPWRADGHGMNDLTKALCMIMGKNYDDFTRIEDFFNHSGEIVEFEKLDPQTPREDGFEYIEEKYNTTINYKQHKVHNLFKFKAEEGYSYSLTNDYNSKVRRHKVFGKWYDWGFFKVKVFKKQTMHVIFKDEDVWVKFNQTAAKAKGFQLASKFTGDYKVKKTDVVKF